uniref:(northern house mosquito) hypothetical protein n=1 Tax=Culex pipiens TaxID=7175 RepID=A0A8D8JE27_CULPI
MHSIISFVLFIFIHITLTNTLTIISKHNLHNFVHTQPHSTPTHCSVGQPETYQPRHNHPLALTNTRSNINRPVFSYTHFTHTNTQQTANVSKPNKIKQNRFASTTTTRHTRIIHL